jgi:hypothetical protein
METIQSSRKHSMKVGDVHIFCELPKDFLPLDYSWIAIMQSDRLQVF